MESSHWEKWPYYITQHCSFLRHSISPLLQHLDLGHLHFHCIHLVVRRLSGDNSSQTVHVLPVHRYHNMVTGSCPVLHWYGCLAFKHIIHLCFYINRHTLLHRMVCAERTAGLGAGSSKVERQRVLLLSYPTLFDTLLQMGHAVPNAEKDMTIQREAQGGKLIQIIINPHCKHCANEHQEWMKPENASIRILFNCSARYRRQRHRTGNHNLLSWTRIPKGHAPTERMVWKAKQ